MVSIATVKQISAFIVCIYPVLPPLAGYDTRSDEYNLFVFKIFLLLDWYHTKAKNFRLPNDLPKAGRISDGVNTPSFLLMSNSISLYNELKKKVQVFRGHTALSNRFWPGSALLVNALHEEYLSYWNKYNKLRSHRLYPYRRVRPHLKRGALNNCIWRKDSSSADLRRV